MKVSIIIPVRIVRALTVHMCTIVTGSVRKERMEHKMSLKTLVDELLTLNDDNLAQRVIENSDV